MSATDKKFRELQRDWDRSSIHTAFLGRGQHLVQRSRTISTQSGFRQVRYVVRTDNRRRQAPYLPASPKIDGVRMRWEKGQLVPRNSTI